VRTYENPNGFTVEVLRENPDGSALRRHRWAGPGQDGDIHAHRGDYDSGVEEGTVFEEIYGYEDDPDGGWDRMLVDCIGDDGSGTYRTDVKSSVRCRVTLLRTEVHQAGETYHRDARELHRIVVPGPAVTLVRFGPSRNRVHVMIRRREESS
jgi:hypothetical protein